MLDRLFGLMLERLRGDARRCGLVRPPPIHLPNPRLHFLPGLERDHALGLDGNPLPRPGIAAHPCLTAFDLEDPEVSQLDPPLLHERFDQGIERSLDQFPGPELREVELFGDRPDNVFLGHGSDAPATLRTAPPEGQNEPETGRKNRRKPKPDKH